MVSASIDNAGLPQKRPRKSSTVSSDLEHRTATSPSIDPEEGISVANDKMHSVSNNFDNNRINNETDSTDSGSDIPDGKFLKNVPNDSDSSSDSDSDSVAMKDYEFNDEKENNNDYNNNAELANSDDNELLSNSNIDSESDDLEDDIILNLYSEDAEIPHIRTLKPSPKLRTQLRNFLKSREHEQFLEKLIPVDATPFDIMHLSKLLGFVPKNENILHEVIDPLQFSIRFLQKSINEIYRSRTKLSNFHTINHMINAIKNSNKIIVLTGAGISTSLGIPDFRSSQGFYSKMKSLNLDDPQDVFDLFIFKEDPSIFYSIAYMILPPEGSFTPLHGFIKLLQDKNKLLRNYTQNIDNLEGNVGLEPDKVIQCHGSFASASCVSCKFKVPGETIYPFIKNKKIPYCAFCKSERRNLIQKFNKAEDEGSDIKRFKHLNSFGVMKPDITFFHEGLPDIYHNTIKQDVQECDLLICIGTSLKVAPVSDIVNILPENVPQILINRDPINHHEFDVEILGYCDQAITWMCNKDNLNWKINHKDFEKILSSGLELDILDENYGRYRITDSNEREKIKNQEDNIMNDSINNSENNTQSDNSVSNNKKRRLNSSAESSDSDSNDVQIISKPSL